MLWTIVSVTVAALILGGLFYCWGWEDGKNNTDDEPERFSAWYVEHHHRQPQRRKGRGLTTPAHGPARTRG